MVHKVLGHAPATTSIHGGQLHMAWIAEHFSKQLSKAEVMTVQFHTKAPILRLIEGFIFPDKSQNLVKLVYIELLRVLVMQIA